jgi:putative mycofactocin binding protein MftB
VSPRAGTAPLFDLDAAYELHPQVSVRPERFGALLYHFGTRRLTFLKSPALLTVVSSLASEPSARAACAAAGLTDAELPAYCRALATLVAGRMICARPAPTMPAPTMPAPTMPALTRTEP